MSYKDMEREMVYVGKSEGCIVATENGQITVRYGESMKLKGIQLTYARNNGWIEKEIYDEEYNQ